MPTQPPPTHSYTSPPIGGETTTTPTPTCPPQFSDVEIFKKLFCMDGQGQKYFICDALVCQQFSTCIPNGEARFRNPFRIKCSGMCKKTCEVLNGTASGGANLKPFLDAIDGVDSQVTTPATPVGKCPPEKTDEDSTKLIGHFLCSSFGGMKHAVCHRFCESNVDTLKAVLPPYLQGAIPPEYLKDCGRVCSELCGILNKPQTREYEDDLDELDALRYVDDGDDLDEEDPTRSVEDDDLNEDDQALRSVEDDNEIDLANFLNENQEDELLNYLED